jgi:hypothetical protein
MPFMDLRGSYISTLGPTMLLHLKMCLGNVINTRTFILRDNKLKCIRFALLVLNLPHDCSMTLLLSVNKYHV